VVEEGAGQAAQPWMAPALGVVRVVILPFTAAFNMVRSANLSRLPYHRVCRVCRGGLAQQRGRGHATRSKEPPFHPGFAAGGCTGTRGRALL